ncbi:deoxyribonuclease IV [Geobacter sp. AOG1]|uniref:deoxyribonuclease IV n=1 Tax=Geobacter sp. AOG1 TaxID=1566346 RepID=UPI001CC356D3|nr:deoxyribonuclease IV [Geobacter sp. AOG1]GFE56162.1 putative endonuclease 4 [Geobacter sp. AOG1]
MDYLGAHMSIAGGIHLAPERGAKAGCGVIQVFTQNSNQWRGKMPSAAEAALFREKWAASGLHEVVCHDIYLVNLGAAPGEVRDKSLAGFAEEMRRCECLGIRKIVMHPGSHNGDGEEVGIKRVCAAFDELFALVPEFTGKVLLETTAGQGTNLGYSFEHLRAIMDGTSHPDRFAVCYDTCHTFAAGYDITSDAGYRQVMADFDRIIGIGLLQCFHINDSKKGLNCRVDRHEHIGQGAMGLNGFRFIMNDPRFVKIPKILETPKGDNDEMDEVNLGVLRDLVKP